MHSVDSFNELPLSIEPVLVVDLNEAPRIEKDGVCVRGVHDTHSK